MVSFAEIIRTGMLEEEKAMSEFVLQTIGLTKKYPHTTALDNVNVTIIARFFNNSRISIMFTGSKPFVGSSCKCNNKKRGNLWIYWAKRSR